VARIVSLTRRHSHVTYRIEFLRSGRWPTGAWAAVPEAIVTEVQRPILADVADWLIDIFGR
jgi:hypothetical protein